MPPPPTADLFELPPAAPPPAPAVDHGLEIYRAIASVIAASAAVLATRVILLLALFGAFGLAAIASLNSSWIGFAVLIAFAVLVLIPLVLLEAKTKWQGG